MDLASAPALPTLAPHAAPRQANEDGLRLVSPSEARESVFLAQWERLVDRASEPNPFFEPWFLLPSLARCNAGESIRLKAYYRNGVLCGLMPVVRGARYYGYPVAHATGWLHDNAFCGAPLIARGCERDFWRALLKRFDDAPRCALFLHLPAIPADGPIGAALEQVLAEDGRLSVTVDDQSRAMLASRLAPEDYLAQAMSAKKRKELRRQQKRLSEEGALTFERCEDADGLEAWTCEYLALEASGWKGEAGSALACARETERFFIETLHGAAKAGRLERLTLRLDGKPIAMLANFLCPPGAFSFKTTFDERFARYSPGLLLQIENLELLGRSDIDWADSCAVQGHSM
ncbi:MAG: GNAT family N-acetyltransferase, partial [Pseudomonadota bacterium]